MCTFRSCMRLSEEHKIASLSTPSHNYWSRDGQLAQVWPITVLPWTSLRTWTLRRNVQDVSAATFPLIWSREEQGIDMQEEKQAFIFIIHFFL